MNDILTKRKSFYFDDYEKALSNFEPAEVVNKWLNLYIEKSNNDK